MFDEGNEIKRNQCSEMTSTIVLTGCAGARQKAGADVLVLAVLAECY